MMLFAILFLFIGISTCQQVGEVMRVLNLLNDDLVKKCNDVSLLEGKVQSIDDLRRRIEEMSKERDETTNIQMLGMQKDLQYITAKTLPKIQGDIAEITNEHIPNLKDELEKEMNEAEGVVRSVEAQLDSMIADIRKQAREQAELTNRLNFLEKQITVNKGEASTRRPVLPTVVPTRNPIAISVLRINNYFEEKRANKYIYGPEFKFYKGQYAYRLRIVVKLGGDTGNLTGYISVFIQVMQGADDDYLPWPMKGYFTVFLMPQDSVSDPISLHQIAFGQNGAYKKPGTAGSFSENFAPHNQPWGYPKGFTHDEVESPAYLVDNTILIGYKVTEKRFTQ